MNSLISYTILSECVLYVDSYIKSNLFTAKAVDIDLAVAAVHNSLATHSASGVSILYDAEGIIKAVLGEKICNLVEAAAPADAPTAMAVTHATLDAAVYSVVAIALWDFVVEKKGVVSGLISAMFCMSS
jgi:hypothetical protein